MAGLKLWSATVTSALLGWVGAALAAAPASSPASDLAAFHGKWVCSGNQTDSVFGSGHALVTDASGRSDLDGKWTIVRFDERRTKVNDHPTKGLYEFGYDDAAKQLQVYWIDSLGGFGRQTSAGWQNDTLVLFGDYTTGGQKLAARDTFQKKAGRSFVHRAELQKGDGTWVLVLEETCK
ncbi:MAG: DUF1579 family protein [Bauldia sp.]